MRNNSVTDASCLQKAPLQRICRDGFYLKRRDNFEMAKTKAFPSAGKASRV
jgi:hypothetical protein